MIVQAEEVYIRNRLFKGKTMGAGDQLWLELEPLAKALRWSLSGDSESGFILSEDEQSPGPPGMGKVLVNGTELPVKTEGAILVKLADLAPVIGAKVNSNRELGTVDVVIAKKKGEVQAGRGGIGGYPFTLIEYASPGDALTQYVQPVIKKANAKYGERMQHVVCYTGNAASFQKYKQYKKVNAPDFPSVTLVNSSGEILFQLRGNHVIDQNLMKELRKAIKSR